MKRILILLILLLLPFSAHPASVVMMGGAGTITEGGGGSCTTSNDGEIEATGNTRDEDYGASSAHRARQIVLSATTTVTGVAFQAYRQPTTSVTIRIETDNAGVPSGTLADANLTVSANCPTSTTKQEYIFTTSAQLSAGTYWIRVQPTEGIYWANDTTTPTGTFKYLSGGVDWVAADQHFIMELLGCQ